MKNYLLLGCLSVILISSPVIAQEAIEIPPVGQEDTHHPKDRRAHFENFAKELELTAEQQKQASQLHEEMREKMKPIKEEMKKLREQAEAIREENKKAFESILTPEQKEKLEQMKPPHREKEFKHRHHGKRGFFPHNPE